MCYLRHYLHPIMSVLFSLFGWDSFITCASTPLFVGTPSKDENDKKDEKDKKDKKGPMNLKNLTEDTPGLEYDDTLNDTVGSILLSLFYLCLFIHIYLHIPLHIFFSR